MTEKENATTLHIEDVGTLAINLISAEEELKAAIQEDLGRTLGAKSDRVC